MPNAIDAEKFAFDPEERIALREELGIPQDAFVVGHVGRFMYQKNHKFLIDIFVKLLKERLDARLLLIGEGELMGQIKEKVERLGIRGTVIFTGVRNDVNKLYSVMDVFCLPSFYEGMPVVAWEAQANGLPCVLSNTVCKEAGNNTKNHFLSLNSDTEQWVEEMLKNKRGSRNSVPEISEFVKYLESVYMQ